MDPAQKIAPSRQPVLAATSAGNEASASGVSWSAVIGGGFVTAALSLILLALGAGLGLSSVSPWPIAGAPVPAIGVAAILWMIMMQVLSSSMGGYLAGRLRTKWASIHTDEVYFRDTAHGFLAWAVALVVTAGFLASAAASMAGVAASSVGTGGTTGVRAELRGSDSDGYFVDALLRGDKAKGGPDTATVRGEAGRIFGYALRQGFIPEEDKRYLIQLVETRTGLSQAEAGDRVTGIFDTLQQSADTARKAAAHSLLWIFAALLIGAFCASFSATVGGRQRDNVVVV